MKLQELFAPCVNADNEIAISVPVGYSNNLFECMKGHMQSLRIKIVSIISGSFCSGYDEKHVRMPFYHFHSNRV